MAWLNHFCMLPVRRVRFQMLYLPLSKVSIHFFIMHKSRIMGISCGDLMEHKLLVTHRSQAVLGCLYHFARGEEIFQCLVDDLGYATDLQTL